MHYVANEPAQREHIERLRRELADNAAQQREAERQSWARKGGVQLTASEAFDAGVQIVIEATHAGNMARRRRGDEPYDGDALEASPGPGAKVWVRFRRRREMA